MLCPNGSVQSPKCMAILLLPLLVPCNCCIHTKRSDKWLLHCTVCILCITYIFTLYEIHVSFHSPWQINVIFMSCLLYVILSVVNWCTFQHIEMLNFQLVICFRGKNSKNSALSRCLQLTSTRRFSYVKEIKCHMSFAFLFFFMRDSS